jgi:predicted ATPase/DNA-binding XRE family transcriptional regulator
MKAGLPRSFGAQLRALREAAGFTQEELATITGLSVHAISALERGERRRPHVETVRALSAALDLTGAARDAFVARARTPDHAGEAIGRQGIALPLAPTAIVGREADERTLREWLSDDSVRLITLVGPGGVGKTRLAVELARAISSETATRVTFVALAPLRAATYVAAAIAEALGLSDVTASELPANARVACLDRPTLLVLDNFEHVLDAAPLVADVLAATESLRLLVTSRAPVRVRGEREYAVGPLALDARAAATSPADLARAPAVRLFVERVRDVQPDFRLTPANGPVIAAICRRLDALPLALELAAPWLKVLAPDDLLERITRDVLLPSAGPRDLPERQQTVQATVSWSYQLLDPDERQAFRRLAVLPGRFPIEAAAAVLAGRHEVAASGYVALGATAGLIDKSLLLRAETSVASRPLYHMLETVRACAGIELGASGERNEAMEGLARYCAGEARLAARGLVGAEQGEWLDRVRDDLDSYRTALSWLIEQGRHVEASEIGWALMFHWLIRGHAVEGLRWYQQLLALPSLHHVSEARARVGAALMWFAQGELERAREALERALSLQESIGDPEVRAQAENLSGHIARTTGNLAAARDHFTRGAAAFRALEIPWGLGSTLNGLAGVALATGDMGQAEPLLAEATSVLRQAGPWFLMPVLYVRAILAVRQGHADEAIALVRENLVRIRELHDRFAFVYALVPLAAAASLKGEHAWAARILGVRDAVIERTGITVVDTPVRDLREQAEREARARLGPRRWALAYGAGRRSSVDSAEALYRFVAGWHR